MVSVADAIELAIIVGVNTALAALMTRFLRVRMATRWGTVVYVAFLVPIAQVIVTLVLSGPLGLGANLGSSAAVIGAVVLLPFALGVAFDVLWMPAPEEIEVPDRFRGSS